MSDYVTPGDCECGHDVHAHVGQCPVRGACQYQCCDDTQCPCVRATDHPSPPVFLVCRCGHDGTAFACYECGVIEDGFVCKDYNP